MNNNYNTNITQLNPWIEVAGKLVGKPLYYNQEPLICSDDREIIEAYNEKYEGTDYEFNLSVPPDPFVGNVMNAKLIILSLNPGYVERLNRNLALLYSKDVQNRLIEGKIRSLTLVAKSIYEENDCSDKLLGECYWERMLGKLQRDYYVQYPDKIYQDIAIIQMFGYTSKKFTKHKKLYNLPSHQFALKLIKHLLETKDTTFLVMRHNNEWKQRIQTIVDLEEYQDRFIFNKSHMGNQHLTRTVLGNNYNKIQRILEK